MPLKPSKIKNLLKKAKQAPQDTRLKLRLRKLSAQKVREIKEKHPEATYISNLLASIKVERAIGKGYIDVKAIRVYLSELMKEINSTIERGEKPRLLVKKTYSSKRGVNEFEFVFIGTESERHLEELTYFKKHPKTWTTWGEIVLSPEEVKGLIKLLQDLLKM
jgi:hypothetical protein